MKNTVFTLQFRLALTFAMASVAACKSDEPQSAPTPPAYTQVLDEKPVAVSRTRQQVTLESADSGESVLLKVPANAVMDGVQVRVRLVASGVTKGPSAPVGDLAIEILPRELTFAVPVRARLRVPAPALNKRYAAVQATDDNNVNFAQRSPGRRVGLATDDKPDTEEWEIDLEGGGVWGVGIHSVDLGEQLGGGAVVTDQVEILLLDEEQLIFVGPPTDRRLIVVPAEQIAAASAPASGNGRLVRPLSPLRAGESLSSSAQPRVHRQTIAPPRARQIVQTVSPAPMRGRNAPFNQTVVRVRPAPFDQDPPGMVVPPRPRVVQPLPPTLPTRMRTPVNAPEDVGPWVPTGVARRSPIPVATFGRVLAAASDQLVNYEYDLPLDAAGYWGIADLDSDDPSPVANVVATPSAIDFPSTTVGQTRVSAVALTNNGAGAGTPSSLTLSGPQAGSFSLNGGCVGTALAPGATCTVNITFAPTTPGAHAAAIVVSGGAMEITVNLNGNASLPAGLSLTPQNIDFGSVVTGATSALSDITITNTGGQPAGQPTSAIAGAQAGDFSVASTTCAGMLPPGGTCVMRLHFAPTARGARTASITIAAAPGGSGQVSLTGAGQQPGDLQITPSTFSFGGVALGAASVAHVFTVSNPSDITSGVPSVGLGGANPAAFAITNNGCIGALARNASCMITVVFRPTGSGAALASLQISASPGGALATGLSGNGQAIPALTSSTNALDLGGVVQGQQGTPAAVTIGNDGDLPTGNVSIAFSGPDAADFSLATDSCTGMVVGAGGTCGAAVRFSPTALGMRTASVTFTTVPGGSRTVTLQGTGLAQASLAFSPSAANLGSVVTGQSSATTRLTLTNGGVQGSGVPALTLTGANPADFQIVAHTCMAGIPGGGNCTVDVQFSPGAAGARAAALNVSATPGGTGSVGLSGTGLRPALLVASTASADFGAVVANASNASVTVTITNAGDMTAGTPTPTISGAQAAEFSIVSNSCIGALTGGAPCELQIRFTPTGTGARTASLAVTATPGGTVPVALSGTGLGTAVMSGTPSSLTFGSQLVASASSAGLITLTNGGTATTGTVTLAVTGNNPGDFTTSTACSALAPGDSCAVSVTFTPAESGARSATLTMQATPGGTVLTNLSGSGFTPPALGITPTSLDFGTVVQGSSSTAQIFTVLNSGGSVSSVPNVSLGGANAALFTLTSNGCTAVIPAGVSCTIAVTFTPAAGAAPGAANASLIVAATAGGTPSSTLTGTVRENAIFVATTGTAGNPGTRTQPLRSVQDGVDAAAAAGISRVLVATGSYTPGNGGLSGSAIAGLTLATPVTVSGGYDAAFSGFVSNSVLDVQQGASHVVWISSSNVIIRDLTLQGGTGGGADAVHHYGGGVYVYNGSTQIETILLERLIVQNCASLQDGAGICIFGNTYVTVADSTIANNSASNGVGGLYVSRGRYHTVRNVVFSGNTGYHGALASLDVFDATFEGIQTTGNTGSSGSDGFNMWGGFNVVLRNSDFNEDTVGLFLNASSGSGITNLTIENNVFRNTLGGTNATAIFEGQTPLEPQNFINNRFDLTGLTRLYRNGDPSGVFTLATPAGLTVLNTPGHPDHTIVNTSGNIAY
ncbi:MAG: choice-of-anchor D domain-containing protein [Deltaproteobacteria bacterium]|nr:choice-of-anchor D domain-containing protein [Deltaproteobacteria bacterium]